MNYDLCVRAGVKTRAEASNTDLTTSSPWSYANSGLKNKKKELRFCFLSLLKFLLEAAQITDGLQCRNLPRLSVIAHYLRPSADIPSWRIDQDKCGRSRETGPSLRATSSTSQPSAYNSRSQWPRGGQTGGGGDVTYL